MIVFVILIVAAFVFALIVAQIGVVNFPFLSKITLFAPSGPTRVIDSSSANVPAMQKKIEEAISASYKTSDGKIVPVALNFSEEDVTAFIQDQLNVAANTEKPSKTENTDASTFTVKKAQVAFEPDLVEFYADFTGDIPAIGLSNVRTNSSLLVTFRPYLENETVLFDVKSVRIGGLRLPHAMVEQATAQIIGTRLQKFNADIAKKMVLKQLSFRKGIMSISADLKPGEAFVIEQVH